MRFWDQRTILKIPNKFLPKLPNVSYRNLDPCQSSFRRESFHGESSPKFQFLYHFTKDLQRNLYPLAQCKRSFLQSSYRVASLWFLSYPEFLSFYDLFPESLSGVSFQSSFLNSCELLRIRLFDLSRSYKVQFIQRKVLFPF